jgi:hypothetical protein
MTVDDFVSVKASDFNKTQQLSTSGSQQVQYQSVINNKFQQIYGLESGSGPGGRRFKSSLPDQFLQLTRDFWCAVYTGVDDFVTVMFSASRVQVSF